MNTFKFAQIKTRIISFLVSTVIVLRIFSTTSYACCMGCNTPLDEASYNPGVDVLALPMGNAMEGEKLGDISIREDDRNIQDVVKVSSVNVFIDDELFKKYSKMGNMKGSKPVYGGGYAFEENGGWFESMQLRVSARPNASDMHPNAKGFTLKGYTQLQGVEDSDLWLDIPSEKKKLLYTINVVGGYKSDIKDEAFADVSTISWPAIYVIEIQKTTFTADTPKVENFKIYQYFESANIPSDNTWRYEGRSHTAICEKIVSTITVKNKDANDTTFDVVRRILVKDDISREWEIIRYKLYDFSPLDDERKKQGGKLIKFIEGKHKNIAIKSYDRIGRIGKNGAINTISLEEVVLNLPQGKDERQNVLKPQFIRRKNGTVELFEHDKKDSSRPARIYRLKPNKESGKDSKITLDGLVGSEIEVEEISYDSSDNTESSRTIKKGILRRNNQPQKGDDSKNENSFKLENSKDISKRDYIVSRDSKTGRREKKSVTKTFNISTGEAVKSTDYVEISDASGSYILNAVSGEANYFSVRYGAYVRLIDDNFVSVKSNGRPNYSYAPSIVKTESNPNFIHFTVSGEYADYNEEIIPAPWGGNITVRGVSLVDNKSELRCYVLGDFISVPDENLDLIELDLRGKLIYECVYKYVNGSFILMDWKYHFYGNYAGGVSLYGEYNMNGLYRTEKSLPGNPLGLRYSILETDYYGTIKQEYATHQYGIMTYTSGATSEYGNVRDFLVWDEGADFSSIGCGCDGYSSIKRTGKSRTLYFSLPSNGNQALMVGIMPPHQSASVAYGKYKNVSFQEFGNPGSVAGTKEVTYDIYGIPTERVNQSDPDYGRSTIVELRPGFSYTNPYSVTTHDTSAFEYSYKSGSGVVAEEFYENTSNSVRWIGTRSSGREYRTSYSDGAKRYEATPTRRISYRPTLGDGVEVTESDASSSSNDENREGVLDTITYYDMDSNGNVLSSRIEEKIGYEKISRTSPFGQNITYENIGTSLWRVTRYISENSPDAISTLKMRISGYSVPNDDEYHVFMESLLHSGNIQTRIIHQVKKNSKLRQVVEVMKDINTLVETKRTTTYLNQKEINFKESIKYPEVPEEVFVSGYTNEYNELGEIKAIYHGRNKADYDYVLHYSYYPKTAAISAPVDPFILVVSNYAHVIESLNPPSIYGKGRLKSVIFEVFGGMKKGVKFDYIPDNMRNAGAVSAVTYIDDFVSLTGPKVNYVYDDKGNIIHAEGYEQIPVSYEYDDMGDLVKMTLEGAITTWAYDKSTGLPKSKTDGVGNVRSTTYVSGTSRVSKTTDERGIETQYQRLYSEKSDRRRYWVHIPNHKTITYDTDFGDNVLYLESEGKEGVRSIWSYEYAAHGNIPTKENLPDSYSLVREFDAFGNVSHIEVKNKFNETLYSVAYENEPSGSIKALVVGEKRIEYERILKDRRINKIKFPIGSGTLDLNYGYDGLTRITEIAMGSARKISYMVNSLDKILSSTYYEFGDANFKWNYRYTYPQYALQSAKKSHPSSNENPWVAEIPQGEGVSYLSYGYGNFTTHGGNFQEESLSGVGGGPKISYFYDGANRLLSKTNNAFFAVRGSAALGTDIGVKINDEATPQALLALRENGNRQEYLFGLEYGDAVSYPLIKVEASRVQEDGTLARSMQFGRKYLPPKQEGFTHDAAGNLTHDGRWQYDWDGEGRLVNLETSEDAVLAGIPWRRIEYDYDWKGLKTAERKFIKRADGEIILERESRRIYDNYNMILEIIDTSGKPREVRKYYYGEDAAGSLYATGGTRGLVMIEVNGTQAYVMSDILGSVDSLYRSDTGELIGSYEYDAWGEITDIRQSERFASGGHNSSSTSETSNQQSLNIDLDYQKLLKTNPIRYSTRYYESEPNLHYYAFRHYAPTLKRWLSRDPIEEVGGHNLYTFCNNDPIGKFDSLGLSSTVCYPDGTTSCKIDIFVGHGDYYYDDLKWTVNYALKNAKQELESAGVKTSNYALGAVSCYDERTNTNAGEYGYINPNRISKTRYATTSSWFGYNLPDWYNRWAHGGYRSLYTAISNEVDAARVHAYSSMCSDGMTSGQCCRTVLIRLIPLDRDMEKAIRISGNSNPNKSSLNIDCNESKK